MSSLGESIPDEIRRRVEEQAQENETEIAKKELLELSEKLEGDIEALEDETTDLGKDPDSKSILHELKTLQDIVRHNTTSLDDPGLKPLIVKDLPNLQERYRNTAAELEKIHKTLFNKGETAKSLIEKQPMENRESTGEKQAESPPPDLPVAENAETPPAVESAELSEERKNKIVEESLVVYRRALEDGKSPNQARDESHLKFVESVADIDKIEDRNEMLDELKNKWSELEKADRAGAAEGERETGELEQRLREEKEPLSQTEDELLGEPTPPPPTPPTQEPTKTEPFGGAGEFPPIPGQENIPPSAVPEPTTPEPAREPAAEPEPKATVEKEKKPEEEKIKNDLEYFGIKPDDLAKEVPVFNDLSDGRKLLVLENLKQITLGRIQEEASDKFREQQAESKWLGRLWQGLTKEYHVAKLEKETAEEIKNGGIRVHGDILGKLVTRSEFGPDALLTPEGKLEIQYIDSKNIETFAGRISLTPEEQGQINRFNRIATEYKRMPYEWSINRAEGGQKKEFGKKREEFENSKKEILELIAQKSNKDEADAGLRDIERAIKLDQFLNSHPEVEKALQDIEDQSVWQQTARNFMTSRGAMFIGGGLLRSATISLIGAAGAPLIAAGIGAWRAHSRANEVIRRELKSGQDGGKTSLTRKVETLTTGSDEDAEKVAEISKKISEAGTEDEKKQYREELRKIGKGESKLDLLSFADAEKQLDKLDDLVDKINGAQSFDEQKQISGKLEARVRYIQLKLEQGLINFGEEKLYSQYNLMNSLGRAETLLQLLSMEERKENSNENDLYNRIERFLGHQQKKIDQYVLKQTAKGAGLSAGFALGGWLTRHLAGNLGAAEILSDQETPETALDKLEEQVSKMNEKLAESADKITGINSKDGLDAEDAAKAFNHIGEAVTDEERTLRREKILDAYGFMEVKGTGQTLEDYLIEKGEEAKKALSESKPELAQPPEPATEPVPESKPEPKSPEFSLGSNDIKQSHFENTIEPGGDSVWKSSKEIFMQNRHELGYDVSKDGTFGEWSEKKTAELMKEYAEAHGGKTPELVNPGDKVVLEMEDGKLHLKVVDAAGKEIEPQSLPVKEVTPESTPPAPETIQPEPAAPATETPPAAPETKSVTLDQYKDAFAKTPAESGRWGIVRQYLLNPELKNTTATLSPQELNAFVHMFEGRADEWAGLDKNNLPGTLEQFRNNLDYWTQRLASGELNKIFENGRPDQITELKASVFPVEARNSEIFYMQMQNNGAWKVSKLSELGQQIPQTRKKGLFGGETEFFDLLNVRKILNAK